MKLKDYLPLKAIVDDLGVSRWTLWRAAASDIPGFPRPRKIGRQLYWKKSDLDALEAALLNFQGRCAFDRQRKHEKNVRALTKARTRSPISPRKEASSIARQQDLFSS